MIGCRVGSRSAAYVGAGDVDRLRYGFGRGLPDERRNFQQWVKQ